MHSVAADTMAACTVNTLRGLYIAGSTAAGSTVDARYLLQIGPGTDNGTVTADYSIYVNHTADSYFKGNLDIHSDSKVLYCGASNDMQIGYGGIDAFITTDLQNPSDLVIDCGTEKTMELTVPVYKDINLAGATLALGAAANPRKVKFKDSTGADTPIITYGFDPSEYVSGCFEIQHDYKEGTDITFHVHWQGIAAPAGGTDNVKWQVAYTISRAGEVVSATTTITAESAITVQYDQVLTTFSAIDGSNSGPGGTGIKIGDQFAFQLQRIAASSDEYAGDALLFTAGLHYQVNTLGSRQIATK